MGTLTKNFARLGAVLAISSIALVGCSSTATPDSSSAPSKSAGSSEGKVAAKSEEGAAAFANLFLAALIEEDTTDYENLTPPLELTEEQAQQLMLDGKVDGVSDEQLNELLDFLYENQPLGEYVYFGDDATIQERLQAISALILAQSYATGMTEDQVPEKITAEQVTLEERDGETYASIENDGSSLAPTMIFVDGEWKIDGKELLASFGVSPTDAPTEGETPSE